MTLKLCVCVCARARVCVCVFVREGDAGVSNQPVF